MSRSIQRRSTWRWSTNGCGETSFRGRLEDVVAGGLEVNSSAPELNTSERAFLADALGDTPETVMAVHRLRRGLARAVVAGPPHRPRAAIVQAFSVPEEPAGYGDDPEAIWSLLRDL